MTHTAFLISNSYLLGYTILQSTDTKDSLNECPLLFPLLRKNAVHECKSGLLAVKKMAHRPF